MKKVSIRIHLLVFVFGFLSFCGIGLANSNPNCLPPENSIIGSDAACPGGLDSFQVAVDNTSEFDVEWFVEGGTFVGPNTDVAEVFVQWDNSVGYGKIWFTETCEDVTRFQDTIDVWINYDLDRITLTCFQNINVDFGPGCTFKMHPTEVVTGGEIKCEDDFTLEIISGGSYVPNPIPYSYVGDKLTVTLTHKASGVSCWSFVTLQDNSGPVIKTTNDTIVCTNPILHDPFNSKLPKATALDNCDKKVTPNLVDFSRIDDPTGTYKELIIRKWQAQDKYGNKSNAFDTIFVVDIDIEEIVCPPDTIISCDGKFDIKNPATSGTPTFEGYSVYGDDPYCKIYIVYSDEIEYSCGLAQTIVRKWVIRSFESDSKSERICYQNITIVDDVGPVVKKYDQTNKKEKHPDLTELNPAKKYRTFYYGITGEDCIGEGVLPRPTLDDFCSPDDSIYVKVRLPNNTRSYYNYETKPNLNFQSLSLGKHVGIYKFRDLCDGESTDTVVFVLSDVEKPFPVVDKDAKVSLPNSSYITWVDVNNFDEGSRDNCGIKTILGRRVDWKTSFGVNICDGLTSDHDVNEVEAYYHKVYNDLYWSQDTICKDTLIAGWEEDLRCKAVQSKTIGGGWSKQIPFGCDDACKGEPVQIEILIIDYFGNQTMVWTTVDVEDKSPAQVVAKLDDIYLSCRAFNRYYKDKVQKGDYSVFGKYVFQDAERDTFLLENLVCSDKKEFQGSYYKYVSEKRLDGLIRDNCKPELKEEVSAYFNDCGEGWIERRFTFVSSCSGDHVDPIIYTQKIYIENSCNLRAVDIKWPKAKQIVYGCAGDELPLDEPKVLFEDGCFNFGTSYKDVDINIGQVDTIFRKVKRTWSVRDWCDPLNTELTYEQIIILRNDAPEIKLSAAINDVCIEDNCDYDLVRQFTVSDKCSGQTGVTYSWAVYDNTDLNPKLISSGSNLTLQALGLSEGAYKVAIKASDQSGTTREVVNYFLVKDCQAPSISIKNDPFISLVADKGEVSATLMSRHIDNGSSDNCTIDPNSSRLAFMSDLYYDFSGTIAKDDHLKNYVKCDCYDLGTKTVNYWVSDMSGNSTMKEVKVAIKDPQNYCSSIVGEIKGKVRTMNGTVMPGVKLDLYTGNTKIATSTSGTKGEYTFKNLGLSNSNYYRIIPQMDESSYFSGVDIRDLLLMQFHILGSKSFHSYYQKVASDSNQDGVIEIRDIINFKRLLLQKIEALDYPPLLFANTNKQGQSFGKLPALSDISTFTVVKLGDVDDSYLQTRLNRDDSPYYIQIPNSIVKPNELTQVEFEIPVDQYMTGGYLALQIDNENVELSGVSVKGLDADDYSWDTKGLRLLFLNPKQERNSINVSLSLRSKTEVEVSEIIKIDHSVSQSTILHGEENSAVELSFGEGIKYDARVDNFYPNPFTDRIQANVIVSSSQDLEIRITDVTGKVWKTYLLPLEKGSNHLTVDDLQDMPSGVYAVEIECNELREVRKIVKH